MLSKLRPVQHITAYLNKGKELGFYPRRYDVLEKNGNDWNIRAPDSDEVLNVLNFCSNDVLGLGQHPEVKAAAIAATERFGAGNSSCSIYCGRVTPHIELERAISTFKKVPHTHLFLNAWMALQAFTDTFAHLSMRLPGYPTKLKTLFLLDQENHSCLQAAALNTRGGIAGQYFPNQDHRVQVKAYRHNDMQSLSSRLKRFADADTNVVVMTDSVFSMTGVVCDLPGLIDVLKEHPGTVLLVDEAHASGAIGGHGGGVYDHFNIEPASVYEQGIHPIILSTFSKFAGSIGASISSFSRELIDLLDTARTSSGTASLGAPQAAAARKSIEILLREPERVERLHRNTDYLRRRLEEQGFVLPGSSHIISVRVDVFPEKFTEHMLHEHGVWATPVWFVAQPSLRIMVNATFTNEEMDRLVDALVRTRAYFATSPRKRPVQKAARSASPGCAIFALRAECTGTWKHRSTSASESRSASACSWGCSANAATTARPAFVRSR